MFFEYSDKERDIRRVIKDYHIKIDQEKHEMLMIVLAMSVFYNQILSPLANATSFSDYIQERGVTALKISGYVLDTQEYKKIKKALYHFNYIMQDYNLEIQNFDLSNIKAFIDLNVKWMKG